MRHTVELKMVSTNEGIPETLARALLTNSTENWLTAITDLGILSSQESVEGGDSLCPHTLPVEEETAIYIAQQQQQMQEPPQAIPCLQELTSWNGCAVTPEPSPTPSYTSETVFDFNAAAVLTPLSPASTGVASPSPSLSSEATVDLHFIKEGLRHKIQTKRRRSGLGELTIDVKPEVHDVLTPADENRRERRRASNRRAALKCRQKKKEENDRVMEDYKKTKVELEKVKKELEQLKKTYQEHLAKCST